MTDATVAHASPGQDIAEQLAPLYSRIGSLFLVTILLMFFWVVLCTAAVLWYLSHGAGETGATPFTAGVFAAGGIVLPVIVLLWGRHLLTRCRRLAREHAGAERDYNLGKSGPLGMRWLCVGPEGFSLVGLMQAIFVDRERCGAAHTDGRRIWLEWRGEDGTPRSLWSNTRMGAGVLEGLLEQLTATGWQVEQVPPARMSREISDGTRALRQAALRAYLAPYLCVFALFVPLVLLLQYLTPVATEDPMRGILALLIALTASTGVFLIVFKLYILPQSIKSERVLWDAHLSFGSESGDQ